MKKTYKLLVSLLIPQLAGGLGSIFTANSVGTWYKTLEKGPLNPPSWIFAPVWTTLFVLMGIALYLIWTTQKDQKTKKYALGIFAIQLALNVVWSLLFFGFQDPGLAFGEILVLLLAIISNIIIFWKLNKLSAILLLPYLFWVSFATYLNYSLWQLNL